MIKVKIGDKLCWIRASEIVVIMPETIDTCTVMLKNGAWLGKIQCSAAVMCSEVRKIG